MRRVTIKDIARLSGYSVTTVSRALNHAPEINRETQEHILRVCREQGYRANLLARSLSSSRTNMLGLILPDMTNPYHAALSLNIETCARELGYQVMLCCGRPEEGQVGKLLELLISQQADGILLASSSDQARALMQRFQDSVPCVLIGGSLPDGTGQRLNTVSIDNYVGGRMAAEHLCRLGHRDVVYLGFRSGSATHMLRHRGFLNAARELGMTVETVENRDAFSSIEGGCRLARELFRSGFSQTAVFAASDSIALGVIQVADELGVSIPGRLSVLGFDNIEYAALPNIRLTTFAQNTQKLAQSTVRLLLELIESGDGTVYTQKLLTPALIERSTCAPRPGG